MCGSKRLQRLFNAINVGSGLAKRVDAIAEAPLADAFAARDERRAAARRAPSLAVPLRDLGAALERLNPQFAGMRLSGQTGAAHGTGQRRLLGEDAPAFQLPSAPPTPQIWARDTEWTLRRGPDGMPEVVRA